MGAARTAILFLLFLWTYKSEAVCTEIKEQLKDFTELLDLKYATCDDEVQAILDGHMKLRQDGTPEQLFTVELAPSFGKPSTREATEQRILETAAESLKQKLRQTSDKSWKNLSGIMESSNFTASAADRYWRASTFRFKRDPLFKFTGRFSGASGALKEWFETKLVQGDTDYLDITRIDMETMGALMSGRSAPVKSVKSVFTSKTYKELKVVEVGILWYPHEETPRMKLFRVEMFAWRRVKRTLFHTKVRNAVRGVFNAAEYTLKKSVRQEVLEAECLLSE